MALDPPEPVVKFLNIIGIDWPMINEDKVRELASNVKDFSDGIQQAHQDATSTIQQMSGAYQGRSYETLVERWSEMSSTHMNAMTDTCTVIVDALDAAADFIVAQKGVAIAELIGLAVSFVADQAAAVVTFGLSELAEAGLIKLAETAVDALEQQLEQYVISEVVEAGFKALAPVVQQALDGFVFSAVQDALGVPSGGGGSVGPSFEVQPDQLRAHAQVMQTHADTVASHAQLMSSRLSGVDFT